MAKQTRRSGYAILKEKHEKLQAENGQLQQRFQTLEDDYTALLEQKNERNKALKLMHKRLEALQSEYEEKLRVARKRWWHFLAS